MTRSLGNWTYITRLGFVHKHQRLRSSIFYADNEETTGMRENYQNNLLWQKVSIYSGNSFQLKTARSKIDVDLPLNLLNLNIEDENLFKEQKIRRFLVEPKLRFQYHLTALWQTRFSIKYTNRFSDINQLHYGNILRNYRTLQINDASLPETTSRIYSSSFSYRNPISSVFFNTSYGFTSSTYNVLTQTEVQKNGINYSFCRRR